MKINSIKNNPSFNGRYLGYAITTGALHKYPAHSVHSCIYADRKMMSMVQNMLESSKLSKDLSISVENDGSTNYLSIVANRKAIKKSLPFFYRLARGKCSPSLSDDHFWGMITNKNVQYLKYQICQSDVKKMIRDFGSKDLSLTLLKVPMQDNSIKGKMRNFVDAVQGKMPKNSHNAKKLKKIFAPAYQK